MVTYSFTDLALTINCPGVGSFSFNGTGVGSVSVQMSNDRTAHDVAADGSIMVSKIKARNGLIAISCQQTSDIHAWLSKWFNYLETSDSSQYETTNMSLISATMGDKINATRVCPQKQADRPYQAQGQQVTWNLMAADIQQTY